MWNPWLYLIVEVVGVTSLMTHHLFVICDTESCKRAGFHMQMLLNSSRKVVHMLNDYGKQLHL